MAQPRKSSRKVISRKVAIESMDFEGARKLLDKEGFSRVVIIRRDDRDPRKILNISVHEFA